MDPSSPELSAVVVVGSRRARAAGCLRSLLAQDAIDRMEVLLVDCGGAGAAPVAGSDHPAVRVVPMSPGSLFAHTRAAGVRLARAPVVAFLEEHARALPGWAAALIAAHRDPWVGVGAEARCANPGIGRSDVIALLSYGYWFPPLARGETALLPGHNASFKRAALLALGPDLERLLTCDLVLHGALRRRGGRLLMEPAARFSHLSERGLRDFGRGVFFWYRCYGDLRAREGRWPAWRRLAYLVLAPAIPFYFLLRFGRFLRRTRPRQLPLLLRNAPFVLAVHACGAAGQVLGLLRGPGDAEARFSRYELEAPRPERS
jgi:GT2 family glycosyltransferase